MRSRSIRLDAVPFYLAGDALLETHRLDSVALPILDKKEEGIFDLFTPEKDDYKGLRKGLDFLKFTPSEAETLFNVIGSAANLAVGIVSVVGIAGSVIDIMGKLGIFKTKEDATTQALKQIGMRVEQIYGYLAAQDRRGLYTEALNWRIAATLARQEVQNVTISRSPENLRSLIDRAAELDRALLQMLDVGKAKIAFQRAVYGNGYWIGAAVSPFMSTAAGASIDFADPAKELQTEIWDAGHYFDVLLAALSARMLVATAIEPAFRSTGYDRDKLQNMATGVLNFIHAWRGSIFVCDPVAAINPGGNMRSPYHEAPLGIPLGVIDPVTGITSFWSDWDEFPVLASRTDYLPFEAHGSGIYDETQAKDPDVAVANAKALQAKAVDQVIKACGIERMMTMQYKLRDLVSAPAGSDFVSLPNPTFHRSVKRERIWFELVQKGDPVTVDLGDLKIFAADPNKRFQGLRFYQDVQKDFTFRMARRTDISHVQLGYRITIAGENINLIDFSVEPAAGNAAPFPTQTIVRDIDVEVFVYDCHQSDHLTAVQEDAFERDGRVVGVERLFLNKRVGHPRFRVTVTFTPFAADSQSAYAGEAHVSILALDPTDLSAASILSVMVFETHVGLDNQPDEVIADTMTVHMVPSYVVFGPDYFAAFHEAMARMAKTIKGINDRFSLQDMQFGPPSPDPAFSVANRFEAITRNVDFIKSAQERIGEAIQVELARNIPPLIQG